MNQSIKKKSINRLNRIAGQIQGLQRMIENGKYCIDIIYQSTAVKNALSSLEDLILQNHLTTHAVHQIKHNNSSKAVNEIMKVYKLSKDK